MRVLAMESDLPVTHGRGDEIRSMVTPASTVAEATAALEASGQYAAVVMDRGEPVGVITTMALQGRFGRVPRPDAVVADVMDLETVQVEPDAEVVETFNAYTDAGWRSLRRRHPCATETLARRAALFEAASPNGV